MMTTAALGAGLLCGVARGGEIVPVPPDCDGSGIPDIHEIAGVLYGGEIGSNQLLTQGPGAEIGAFVLGGSFGEAVSGIHGMAVDPTTGLLWALAESAGTPGDQQLVSIDPQTGVATPGPIVSSAPQSVREIVFTRHGKLWAVRNVSPSITEFLRYDPVTGFIDSASLWTENSGTGHALALNPANGLIYHAYGTTLRVIEPAPSGFFLTLKAQFNGVNGQWDSMAFTADGSRLVATAQGQWYEIDPATGAGTLIVGAPAHPAPLGGLVYIGVLSDSDGDGVPDVCECPGDLSMDGEIDVEDLNLVLSNWAQTGGAGLPGDATRDGVVDVDDLNAVLSGFGGPCE